MILVVILAVLAITGAIGAGVATVRDARGSVPRVTGYDTRRPLP